MIRHVALIVLALAACDESDPEVHVAGVSTCGETRLAPPAFVHADGRAVPIDVSAIEAALDFDGVAREAHGHAKMSFQLGPEAGYPTFDLRQARGAAWLDGERLEPAEIVRRSPVEGRVNTTLVLDRALEACSVHTLEIDYTLADGDAVDERIGPVWDASTLFFSNFRDLGDARYLELWAPAPNLGDTFTLTFEIAARRPRFVDDLIANAPVEAIGREAWRVAWREADITTPMLLVVERGQMIERTDPSGLVRLLYHVRAPDFWTMTRPEEWLDAARATIVELSHRFGPRRGHEAPFLLVVSPAFAMGGGMEYPNGTFIDSPFDHTIRHEVAHAWFGRTLFPARYPDQWMDETLANWVLPDRVAPPQVRDPYAPEAVPAVGYAPWSRASDHRIYGLGFVFDTLVDRFGANAVDAVLRMLIARCGGPITHHDLVRAFMQLDDPGFVEALFTRWVIDPADLEVRGTCAMR